MEWRDFLTATQRHRVGADFLDRLDLDLSTDTLSPVYSGVSSRPRLNRIDESTYSNYKSVGPLIAVESRSFPDANSTSLTNTANAVEIVHSPPLLTGRNY
jgi:hypothetical protein